MKTSNKLILIAALWFLTFMIYDKYSIRKEYLSIDKTEQFGQYPLKDTISFKHLHILGGNQGIVRIGTSNKFSGLQYNKHMKKKFATYVSNDTLYLSFDSTMMAENVNADYYNRLVIHYQGLESITAKKSYINYFGYHKTPVEFNVTSNSRLNVFGRNMGNLNINLCEDSKLIFKGNKKVTIDTLRLRMKSNCLVDFKKTEIKYVDTLATPIDCKVIKKKKS